MRADHAAACAVTARSSKVRRSGRSANMTYRSNTFQTPFYSRTSQPCHAMPLPCLAWLDSVAISAAWHGSPSARGYLMPARGIIILLLVLVLSASPVQVVFRQFR